MAKFVYCNFNPKQLHTNDCLVRALAYFFGVSWRKAFLDIIEWCADRGFERHKTPERGMTVGRFCDEFAEEGKFYMVQVKRHMTIVDNKEINDTWDCSNRIVEYYWVR